MKLFITLTKALSFLSFLAIVFSCSNDVCEQIDKVVYTSTLKLSQEEAIAWKITAENGNTLIPEEEAISMIQKMFITNKQTKSNTPFIVKKCQRVALNNAITKSGNVIYYYVVEFIKDNKSGFSIVSADRRIPEVFSYSENGSFADTTFNKGLRIFRNDLESYIQQKVNRYNQILRYPYK